MAEKAKAKEEDRLEPATAFRLWIGMLLPPVAWAIQLQAMWLTSEYGCETSDFMWNHVVSITGLVVSAVGTFVAYSEYRKWAPAGDNARFELGSRRRFMAMVGVMSGALFTVVIFAQWLPTLLGVPCDK